MQISPKKQNTAHDDLILVINHIFNHKSLLEHLQYAASGPLANIWFLTDNYARLT